MTTKTKKTSGTKRNSKTRPQGKKATKAADGAKATKKADTGKPAAKKGNDKKLSCLDAAAKVLAESKDALNTTEMFNAMVTKKYWSSDAPTPQNTIYAAILREIKTKGKESRFCKTERGRFGLNK